MRRRSEILFGRHDLPEGTEAISAGGDGRPVLVVTRSLGRRLREAALAHELVHHERGPCSCTATWDYVCNKEERKVDRIVADRMLPGGEVLAFAQRRAELGEPTTVTDLAEEFDVAEWVAEIALRGATEGAQ